jgi:LPS export ABC transporter permease LptG
MKRLDLYLMEELLPPFLVGVLTVLVLMLGDELYRVMQLVLSKGVEPGVVLQLLLFKLPEVIVLAFPLSAILAVSLAVNRLAREQELAAMRIGGFGLPRVLATILAFGLGVTVVDFTINEKITPAANYAFRNLQQRLVWQNPAPLLEARRFFQPPGEQDTYIYIGSIDDQTQELHDVLIFRSLLSDYPWSMFARTARYRDGVWYLRDVIEHRWHTNGVLVQERGAARVEMNLKQMVEEGWIASKDAASKSLAELKKEINLYERNRVPVSDMRFEYYQKFSTPAGCLVLALLAAALGIRASRAGSYAGLLIAVVLAFLYFLLRTWFDQLGRHGLLPPLLAAWAQNLLFGGLGLLLLRRL